MAACVQCLSSSGKLIGCDISGPGLESRGVVLDRHSHVDLDSCNIHDTWNSGVWARGDSTCTITSSTVAQCGGYGSIYSTNGAVIKVDEVKQSSNPRGCGVFVLHDRSRVFINRSIKKSIIDSEVS